MRRSTVLLLATLALVLAACQIRTDYGLRINDDTSAELGFEMSYDEEATQLFGPAEAFVAEEFEGSAGDEIEGVTLVETTADSSDPQNQRVGAIFAAEDGAALDRLVRDLFPGSSFTNAEGSTWTLTLRTDEDVAADFGEEIPLEGGLEEFLAGEFRVAHAGTQVSMQGGTADGQNQVVWNPYLGENLEVVMDLSTGGAAPALEEPDAAEPTDEAAVDDNATDDNATDDNAADGNTADEGAADDGAADDGAADDEVAADPPAEDDAAAEDGAATDQGDLAVTTTDDEGLSTLLLAAIAGGLLLLLLLVVALVLRGRREDAPQPVAAGAGPGGWAPPAATAPQQPYGGAPQSPNVTTQPLPPSGPAAAPPPGRGTPPPPGPGAPPPATATGQPAPTAIRLTEPTERRASSSGPAAAQPSSPTSTERRASSSGLAGSSFWPRRSSTNPSA